MGVGFLCSLCFVSRCEKQEWNERVDRFRRKGKPGSQGSEARGAVSLHREGLFFLRLH